MTQQIFTRVPSQNHLKHISDDVDGPSPGPYWSPAAALGSSGIIPWAVMGPFGGLDPSGTLPWPLMERFWSPWARMLPFWNSWALMNPSLTSNFVILGGHGLEFFNFGGPGPLLEPRGARPKMLIFCDPLRPAKTRKP